MIKLIFSFITLLSGIICFVFAKNKKIYERFRDNGGETFADKSIRQIRLSGFILLFFTLFWMIYYIIEKGSYKP